MCWLGFTGPTNPIPTSRTTTQVKWPFINVHRKKLLVVQRSMRLTVFNVMVRMEREVQTGKSGIQKALIDRRPMIRRVTPGTMVMACCTESFVTEEPFMKLPVSKARCPLLVIA